MKKVVSLVLLLLIMACKNEVSQDKLILLNGYWEIEKVVMANGQTKEYNINTTIDYIELNDLSGFRKKVYPKLDGTYDTTDDAEHFTIVAQKGAFEIRYQTDLSKWIELLKSLDKNSFSVINSENITYHYKRFEPINITK
ncbi:hypothetical protein [Maribacter sp. HTCC2170]|uniref:hypothetical protein n=1 Tax=Maribacter sp. (strain HTCC2170 / KCCM 42371) TaxID=313603 RepID=UPI00006B4928|nr:hypothetical protein [Maribacter sp. HTCC2170]EAR01007.1 hypothetical protein FB2170_09556 [Maribacter sp. HTCC2170]